MTKNVESILENWATLNARIHECSEEECADLLARERLGKRRATFLLRLYGRFNTLRTTRERQELLGS